LLIESFLLNSLFIQFFFFTKRAAHGRNIPYHLLVSVIPAWKGKYVEQNFKAVFYQLKEFAIAAISKAWFSKSGQHLYDFIHPLSLTC
jgi:hypothetical protein